MPPRWQDKISSPATTAGIASTSEEDSPPAVIMLVTGEDTEGTAQWAYAKITAENYAAFKMAEEEGNYNLANFGEILKSGRGKAPSEVVRREMQEQHGCNDHFEDSLAKMMEEAISAWDENISRKDEES